MSPEELAVAMDEARRLRVPVMAHAHSSEGIVQAIEAGVRSIEHGTFIDEKGIRLARKRGTYLVPTFYLGDYYISEMAELSGAYAQINDELRSQYVVGYYSHDAGGREWRKVDVDVAGSGLKARTIAGYFR